MQNVNANFHRKDKIRVLSLSPAQFCYCFVYDTNIKPGCKGRTLGDLLPFTSKNPLSADSCLFVHF